MDLGEDKLVNGIAMQGGCNTQWVKSFTVKYWRDGKLVDSGNVLINPSRKVLTGEYNRIMFTEGTVMARHIRIVVQSWASHISMRAGVLFDLNPVCVHGSKCGGTNRNNVYLSEPVYHPDGESQNSTSLNSTVEVDPIGRCYYDLPSPDTEFSDFFGTIPDNHPSGSRNLCISLCRTNEFKYAGISERNQCSCSNGYGKYGQAPFEDCDHMCQDLSSPKVRCGGVLRRNVFKVTHEVECSEGFVNEESGELVAGQLDETNVVSSKYVKLGCNGDGTGTVEKKCYPITCPLFSESLPGNSVLLEDSVFLAVHDRNLQEVPIKGTRYKLGPDATNYFSDLIFDGSKTGASWYTHSKSGISNPELYIELEFPAFVEEIAMFTKTANKGHAGRWNAYTFKAVDQRTNTSSISTSDFVKEQGAREYQYDNAFRHSTTVGKHGTGYRYLTEKRGQKYLANNITMYGIEA